MSRIELGSPVSRIPVYIVARYTIVLSNNLSDIEMEKSGRGKAPLLNEGREQPNSPYVCERRSGTEVSCLPDLLTTFENSPFC
jgi:hypothetical protein